MTAQYNVKNAFLISIKVEKQLMSRLLLISNILQPNICNKLTKVTMTTCKDSPHVCEYVCDFM